MAALEAVLLRPTPYPPGAAEAFWRRIRSGPIVHRGGEPENTLSAFRLSKANNAIGVEIDIMLTSDGHCVLLHDETVDRTSDGSGMVRNLTLRELRNLKFGMDKKGHTGERIATLEEAICLCEELDLVVFLDIKPFKTEKDLQKLLSIFTEKPHLYDKVCIISFYIHVLYKLRCMDPKVQCGMCVYHNSLMETVDGHVRTSLWADCLSPLYDWLFFGALDLFLLDFVGVKMLLFCKDNILRNRAVLERWRAGGRIVMAWTVNKDTEKKHFTEVDVPFFTDSPTEQKPEAWEPPTRHITLSCMTVMPWSLLLLLIIAFISVIGLVL